MASRSASSRLSKNLEIELPEAFRDLFRPSRYKAFYGGRGSGKSHSIATALVLTAAQRPLRILAAREIQRSIRDSSKRLLDDRIAALGLKGRYRSTAEAIRGRNGSLIFFAGLRSNPESIKSMEGIDIAWVEEAATVSQASLDILTPTVRKPGSELWFSWNPRQPTDPVDAMFRAGPPRPDAILRRVSFDDNPWFPDVLEAERLWDQQHDPEKYAHVWGGAYQLHAEARVFRNWRIGSLDLPEDARPYFGADWGFAVDPTVLVRCYRLGRTIYVEREAYRTQCPIDAIGTLFREIGAPHPAGAWPITADSARPELIDHLRRDGFRIKPSKKGKNSVEEGIAFLQAHDIVVDPSCRHAIDELTLFSYRIDRLTGDVLPVLEDRHNHVIDALRYALEAQRRGDYRLITLV